MVIVILKDGYTFGFEMASFEKEKALVEKFTSGSLSQTTSLDLKSKGTFLVSDIQGMEFTPTKVLKKEDPEKEKEEKKLKEFTEAINRRKKKEGKEKAFWEKVDALKKKP